MSGVSEGCQQGVITAIWVNLRLQLESAASGDHRHRALWRIAEAFDMGRFGAVVGKRAYSAQEGPDLVQLRWPVKVLLAGAVVQPLGTRPGWRRRSRYRISSGASWGWVFVGRYARLSHQPFRATSGRAVGLGRLFKDCWSDSPTGRNVGDWS